MDIKNFKNPWAEGGAFWNEDVVSSKALNYISSQGSSKRSASDFAETSFSKNFSSSSQKDGCLEALVLVTLQFLENIKSKYSGEVFSIGLLDRIYNEINGLPGSELPSPHGNCCGTFYGVGVYAMKSEKLTDFVEDSSTDYYMKSIVLDPLMLGNVKFGENLFPISKVVYIILKTDRIDRFVKINLEIYRNEICAV